MGKRGTGVKILTNFLHAAMVAALLFALRMPLQAKTASLARTGNYTRYNARYNAPHISTQPASQTITEGQTATFWVSVTGTTPLIYQWKMNGADIAGATSSNYATPASTVANSGSQFSVTVSNRAGSVTSSTASLTVHAAVLAPVIAMQPASQTVTASQSALFSVAVTGTGPLSYQWMRNGAAISGANSPTYAITSVSVSDSGAQFSVLARNSAGSATSKTATLTVNQAMVAAAISTQPVSQSVKLGTAGTFFVAATGTPPFTYQWSKNGVAVLGATYATYTTPAATSSDNGAQFNVSVSNSVDIVISKVAKLTVNDVNSVAMLYPSAPGGSSYFLGSHDPNKTPNFLIEQWTTAVRGTDPNGLVYWNLPSHPLLYASSGSGWTTRLNMYASGGAAQTYTWNNQPGYLYLPADVKNQEETVYIRVHDLLDPDHAGITLKMRGGAHTNSNGDLASCIMFELGTGEYQAPPAGRFGKELHHPDYDWVTLPTLFNYALTENQWVGLKMVSYNSSTNASEVVNKLYLDTDPFDASGQPKNGWRLFVTYTDVDGKSTGRYSKLVNWGGWQTTVRTDGYNDIDFAFPSVREIIPQ